MTKLTKSQRLVLEMLRERPRLTTKRTSLGYISGASAQALIRRGLADRTVNTIGFYEIFITQSGLDALKAVEEA